MKQELLDLYNIDGCILLRGKYKIFMQLYSVNMLVQYDNLISYIYRYLRTLKNMIGNKASVEGSICEAYLMAESTQFFSHYFEPHVMSRHHNVSRNDDGGVMKDAEENLSIFTHPGRLSGEAKKRDLSLEEIKAAQTYILLNCQEVEPFVR